MGQIKILSEEAINQIAAGEVIESPASVVKEVVENALDAGAMHITVEVRGGGFQLIRVTDDGLGMDREDALLSVVRHATSKLRHPHDLFSLQTKGFRGEALASIAAIAELELLTAQEGKEGIKLTVRGGKVEQEEVFPRSRGTTVEVRSLFYNVPARKKFQKSASSSLAEIHRCLGALALSHPEVSFTFINHENTVFSAFAGGQASFVEMLKKRIDAVLGEGVLGEELLLDKELEGYRFRGFLGSCQVARVNRTGQYLFLNRRSIYAPGLSFAIKDGYGTRLDKDRHPVFILHIEAPAHLVDVNVHPQKKEVRFQEEGKLKNLLKEGVGQTLFGPAPVSFPSFSSSFAEEESALPSLVFREDVEPSIPSFLASELKVQVIGLFEHYLFLEGKELEGFGRGLVVVNLKGAHERVIFEKIIQEKVASQGLLFPLTLELGKEEAFALEKKVEQFEKMGFSVRNVGQGCVLVEAIPSFLEEAAVKEVVCMLLEEEFSHEAYRKLSRFVRAQKKVFVLEEAVALAKQVIYLPRPVLSPTGEKIVTLVESDELEKWFRF